MTSSSQSANFLKLLDPRAAAYTFQTFDDNADLKRSELVRIFHGPLEQLTSTLSALNERGAGVFVTINQTDLAGRGAANIKKVRAFFVDTDGAPLEPILEASKTACIKPFSIVESSLSKYHVYWRADCELEEFKGLQSALAEKFGTDKSVCDLPRVMRLPGFIHQKVKKGVVNQPFMTRIIYPKQGGAHDC